MRQIARTKSSVHISLSELESRTTPIVGQIEVGPDFDNRYLAMYNETNAIIETFSRVSPDGSGKGGSGSLFVIGNQKFSHNIISAGHISRIHTIALHIDMSMVFQGLAPFRSSFRFRRIPYRTCTRLCTTVLPGSEILTCPLSD